MLKTLKELFDSIAPMGATQEAVPSTEHRLQLAAAVLLVEVMRSEADIDAKARNTVLSSLRTKFSLTSDEADRLVDVAESTAREASDYFAFTSRINEAFGMEQKIRMVEYMWQVAYADGTLSAHENHVMRRISDLLYIPHGAYVHAKQRARQAAGAG